MRACPNGGATFLLSKTGLETGIIGGDTMRLVVAVTVLSLAISPLGLLPPDDFIITNVNTLAELLSSIYAHEANIVATAASKTRPQIAFVSRRVKIAVRNFRAQHRLRRASLSFSKLLIKLLFTRHLHRKDHPVIEEGENEGAINVPD